MNKTIRSSWTTDLHLDTLGSATVIVTGILLFVAVAAAAVGQLTQPDAQAIDRCAAKQVIVIDRNTIPAPAHRAERVVKTVPGQC